MRGWWGIETRPADPASGSQALQGRRRLVGHAREAPTDAPVRPVVGPWLAPFWDLTTRHRFQRTRERPVGGRRFPTAVTTCSGAPILATPFAPTLRLRFPAGEGTAPARPTRGFRGERLALEGEWRASSGRSDNGVGATFTKRERTTSFNAHGTRHTFPPRVVLNPYRRRVTMSHRTEGLVRHRMSRTGAGLLLLACGCAGPTEHYGFIARLGSDTLSVESVTRRGNTETSDEVDRFPRVRERQTAIELGPDGGIRHLVMRIYTPSEPENQRHLRVVADVTKDSVHVSKTDGTGTLQRAFATDGGTAMAHVPQMYSLYELYFAAALKRAEASKRAAGDTVHMRQFYIDREFDRFPLHSGVVRPLPGGKAEITHDWLAGVGEATFDSSDNMLTYSGARTTYKVDVSRLATPPDVRAIAAQFEATEAKSGVTQLSVRDTVRASIGDATFTVDYGRPLVRGRVLLGNILPYDRVWRTGANAATQFTTSAPINLAGMRLPAGTYTLWTVPRTDGAELIVNRQTGQWGTEYDASQDLGTAPMKTETLTAPVEKFTISIPASGGARGALVMEWGPFRWTAPSEVRSAAKA
jgi:hypothetical protein